MPLMAEYLRNMEEIVDDLQIESVQKTKIHKVAIEILKLEEFPRDQEFIFKHRCAELLARWQSA